MRSAVLSRRLHTLPAAAMMVAVAALFVFCTGGLARTLGCPAHAGLCFGSPQSWGLTSSWAMVLNVALTLGVMAMMDVVNKAFNVLRALTKLQIGLFALFQAAVPATVLTLNTGTMLAAVLMVCVYLMMGCYAAPMRTRRVFLAFMLLSAGASVQSAFLVYIPVLWVVCAQMRILTLRTLVASLLGVATVWVLLLGFGVVSPDQIRLPELSLPRVDSTESAYVLVAAALTAFILIMSMGLNVMKTIAYNARARGYNGALTLIATVTVAACAVDFGNVMAYLTLLNVCAAYQLTHFFVNHPFDRQYAAVLSVAGIYIVLYLWRIAL